MMLHFWPWGFAIVTRPTDEYQYLHFQLYYFKARMISPAYLYPEIIDAIGVKFLPVISAAAILAASWLPRLHQYVFQLPALPIA